MTSNSSTRPKFELLDNFLPNNEKVSFTQFIDDDANTVQNGQDHAQEEKNTLNSSKAGSSNAPDTSHLSTRHVSNLEKSVEPSQKKARKR